jgi:hypothetical protein
MSTASPVVLQRISADFESQTVLRKRTFVGVPVQDVIQNLHGERFTGKLILNMSQGSIGAIVAEDSQQLSGGNGKKPLDKFEKVV